MKTIINILLLFFLITSESHANENLNNKILKNLRCLVCQGQTVQDSNSEFALIIKSVVKDKIKEGNNEKEIYQFPVLSLNPLQLQLQRKIILYS